MPDQTFDDLLDANRRYASGFALGGLSGQPARGFCLVTCMDTRVEPLAVLGLRAGDAKILRNAGGRVTPDVLRSLLLATAFLGVTRVAVMHHTRCALAGQSDSEVRSGLDGRQSSGSAGWDLLAMPDPDAALASDVAAVRSSAALPPDLAVEGWRYDVDTGAVSRVIPVQG